MTLQNTTQKDADAALATLRTFLARWQKREFAKAAELTDERIRLAWQKHMEQRPIRLRSVDNIHVYKRNNELRARVHITVAPKQGIGLDMDFRNGKWWMTGG